jgi:hypothetical protein
MLVRTLSILAIALAPAISFAADDENPYKNAKVGDYATYKITTKVFGQNVEGTMTQTVTAKNDKEATIKVSGKIAGQNIPEQEQKIDLTKPFDPAKAGGGQFGGGEGKLEKLKDGKEEVKVGGKTYKAEWTTYKLTAKIMGQEIEGEAKVWIAKEVPAGMVKMSTTMKLAGQDIVMQMELTETGSKKD